MLSRLEELLKKLRSGGVADGEARTVIARLIHSPVTALLVQLTPNKADDAVLEILKSLVPAPA